MATAAMLENQVNAIKWAISAQFLCNSVHRLRQACWIQKSQKWKCPAIFNMVAVAIFENQVNAIKIGNYRPILMKFGSQNETNMLSLKISQAEVNGHHSRWQLPPFRQIAELV
jgi:hypothetical protein